MQAIRVPERPNPKPVGLLEKLIVGIIFVFPMMGAFLPIEEYMSPTVVHNVHAAMYAAPMSFAISSRIHVTDLVVLLCLTLMNWRGMLLEARLMLPLLVLVVWIFASTLWSIDPSNTIHRAFHMIDNVVFATYLVQRFRWPELISFLTHSFFVIFVLSVIMVVGFPHYGLSPLTGYADAWQGVFTEKNSLGASAVIGSLVAGYSWVNGINKRWYAAFGCLAQVLLVVMSRSATSTVSLLLALGVVIFVLGVTMHRQIVARFFSLVLIGGGVIGVVLLLGGYDSFTEMTGRSADLTGRTEIWHYVFNLIQQKPLLGYGYGFWNVASVPRLNIWEAMGWTLPHAHDEWLDVTLQLGLVGLCIEVFCLGTVLVRAARLSLILADGKALFCGLPIIILCMRGYTETVLTDPSTNSWLWLVICYLTLARMTQTRAEPQRLVG